MRDTQAPDNPQRLAGLLPKLTTVRPNGCWEFSGYIRPDGYGQLGRGTVAHRVAWYREHGSFPSEGLNLDHTCHNADLTCGGGRTCRHRRCVNPDHLEPVTIAENVMRGRGFGPVNRDKTHCAHGHEFNDENTFIKPNGKRACVVCRRVQQLALYPGRADEMVAYQRALRRKTNPVAFAIRAWARSSGIPTSMHGPIARKTVAAYHASHPA